MKNFKKTSNMQSTTAKAAIEMVYSAMLATVLALALQTNASAATIIVPDDHSTIQEGIDAASPGDTVFVRAGTYHENVVITKALTLQGEDRDTTEINGGGTGNVIFYVHVNDVTVTGFKITNGDLYGIYASQSSSSNIRDCEISGNMRSVRFTWGSYTVIANNEVHDNTAGAGIWLDSMRNSIVENNVVYSGLSGIYVGFAAYDNVVRNNVVENNTNYGIRVGSDYAITGNRVYHNDVEGNTNQAEDNNGVTMWDDGYPSGGNYWGDYTGVDGDGDGIGDTPYEIRNSAGNLRTYDYYPLMEPFNVNTPVGTDVIVVPIDSTTGGMPVTVTFDEVTVGGETTLTTSSSGTPPPKGFKLGSPPTYWEIAATADFLPQVEVCIDYSGISFGNEDKLKLFHYEDTDADGIADAWVRVTNSGYPDTTNKIICGTVDSLSEFAVLEAAYQVDIKPGSCPNAFNRHSNGVLPVAIVGTEDFDVTQVDLSTVEICSLDEYGDVNGCIGPHEGPPGPHTVFEDVATPFEGQVCDCDELEGDGILDLSLKFKTADMVSALGLDALPDGALPELRVTGALLDETPIQGSDCVRLVPPGSPPGLAELRTVQAPGAWIETTPLDNQLDGGGFGRFERTFPQSTQLTVTAAAQYAGRPFRGWRVDGGPLTPDTSTTLVVTEEAHTLEAVYTAPAANPCGLGIELALLVPPLIWLHGRRRRRI